jgi:hypothetical protein
VVHLSSVSTSVAHGGREREVFRFAELCRRILANLWGGPTHSVDSVQAALREAGMEHTSRGYVFQLVTGKRPPTPDELGVLVEHLGSKTWLRGHARVEGVRVDESEPLERGDEALRHSIAASVDVALAVQALAEALVDGRLTAAEAEQAIEPVDEALHRLQALRAHLARVALGDA